MLHKGKNSDEVDHFENPFKAFVKTLIMAQGEYQVPYFSLGCSFELQRDLSLEQSGVYSIKLWGSIN